MMKGFEVQWNLILYKDVKVKNVIFFIRHSRSRITYYHNATFDMTMSDKGQLYTS